MTASEFWMQVLANALGALGAAAVLAVVVKRRTILLALSSIAGAVVAGCRNIRTRLASKFTRDENELPRALSLPMLAWFIVMYSLMIVALAVTWDGSMVQSLWRGVHLFLTG